MQLKFKEVIPLEGDVKTFVFSPPDRVSWTPGQFIHFTLPHKDPDQRGDERWFTLSGAPFEGDVRITTRINSEYSSSFKKALLEMAPGDAIEADLPEGDFTVDDPSREYVFVAGGIGITPYHSILKQLDHDGKRIKAQLLYANRDKAAVAFMKDLESYKEKNPDLTVTYFYADHLIDEDALRAAGAKMREPIYFVSGPEPMVEAFKTTLEKIGVDADHSKFDYFPGYDD